MKDVQDPSTVRYVLNPEADLQKFLGVDRYKLARGWLYHLIIRKSLPLKMPKGYPWVEVSSGDE